MTSKTWKKSLPKLGFQMVYTEIGGKAMINAALHKKLFRKYRTLVIKADHVFLLFKAGDKKSYEEVITIYTVLYLLFFFLCFILCVWSFFM